jgi:hypothetical protein
MRGTGDSGPGHTPNAPEASLFPIFMLSMLTLVLVPVTLYAPAHCMACPNLRRARHRGSGASLWTGGALSGATRRIGTGAARSVSCGRDPWTAAVLVQTRASVREISTRATGF